MSLFRSWDQRATEHENDSIVKELALCHARRITSAAERERVIGCITSGDLPSLCDLGLDYESVSVWDAINIRQVSALFSKRADLGCSSSRRRAAVVKFIEAEKRCLETNDILRSWSVGDFKFTNRVESVFHGAQRKIAMILGDVPSLEDLKLRFGPGATTQVQKRNASAKRKLSSTFACSEELLPAIQDVLGEMPTWVNSNEDSSGRVSVEIHHGQLVFVPKNWKTDRSVVVEPSLNTMVQAGIGSFMLEKLRKFGIDLRDQSRNRDLAREGSLTGALATLDLSSASDTIATELVYHLLPIDWAIFLNTYRTKTVQFEGVTLRQEKFSSMGNGFTFPLESLIFYGIASACCPDDLAKVSVYGDDIIVPTYATPLVIESLVAAGFEVNREKSFTSGPFRESCGGDYLRGFDIRPSYLKDRLSAFDLFRLHNQYVRRGDSEAATVCLSFIHPTLRKWGPDGYGDGHLVTDDPCLTPFKRDKGWGGYVFEAYTFRPKRDFTVLPGDRVYPFYSSYARGATEVSESGSVTEVIGHTYDERGRLGVSIPGRTTYNLVKIYVLCSNPGG